MPKITGMISKAKSWVITKEFQKRFKRDNSASLTDDIPLSEISEDGNAFLTREVTNQEILDTLKQISPMEVPGPDGMPVIFYQKN